MSIQRTPFQVQIMTEVNKHRSPGARLMWPPGSINGVDPGLLQPCREGLALHRVLSQPLGHRSPVRAPRPASKNGRDRRWPHGRAPGRRGESLNGAGKRNSCWKHRAATHGSQQESTLTLDWAVLPRGRCNKRTDTGPICMADHHLFTPRNTLHSPNAQPWTEVFSEY